MMKQKRTLSLGFLFGALGFLQAVGCGPDTNNNTGNDGGGDATVKDGAAVEQEDAQVEEDDAGSPGPDALPPPPVKTNIFKAYVAAGTFVHEIKVGINNSSVLASSDTPKDLGTKVNAILPLKDGGFVVALDTDIEADALMVFAEDTSVAGKKVTSQFKKPNLLGGLVGDGGVSYVLTALSTGPDVVLHKVEPAVGLGALITAVPLKDDAGSPVAALAEFSVAHDGSSVVGVGGVGLALGVLNAGKTAIEFGNGTKVDGILHAVMTSTKAGVLATAAEMQGFSVDVPGKKINLSTTGGTQGDGTSPLAFVIRLTRLTNDIALAALAGYGKEGYVQAVGVDPETGDLGKGPYVKSLSGVKGAPEDLQVLTVDGKSYAVVVGNNQVVIHEVDATGKLTPKMTHAIKGASSVALVANN